MGGYFYRIISQKARTGSPTVLPAVTVALHTRGDGCKRLSFSTKLPRTTKPAAAEPKDRNVAVAVLASRDDSTAAPRTPAQHTPILTALIQRRRPFLHVSRHVHRTVRTRSPRESTHWRRLVVTIV